MDTSKVILEVKNLSKVYTTKKTEVKALSGVSFTVREGETIGIVGESGCGKTTLGRSIVRGIDATGGEVLLHTEDGVIDFLKATRAQMKKYRRDIQMIFQDPQASLDPRKSVKDLIGEPLKNYKVCKTKDEYEAKVKEIMETVGLADRYAESYSHELDGGRRQRIGIGRALAMNPEFIVCDEPVSALDVSIQANRT